MAECGSRLFVEGDLPESPPASKKPRSSAKRANDRLRGKTRINIGAAFPRWRALRAARGFHLDSELAFLLLDAYDYLRTKVETRPQRPTFERSSSTETCDSVRCEYPFMMSSPEEDEQETAAALSVHSSENEKESGEKDAALRLKIEEEWTTTNQNKEKRHIKEEEDDDEEFSTSLSVGDGHYLVDLGSSSEFVVDEECILQLFKSCRECNRQCTVRKKVRGLKLVVNQACCYCQSRFKWTNLPDEDDGDFQINGQVAAQGQTDSTVSPSSNTS